MLPDRYVELFIGLHSMLWIVMHGNFYFKPRFPSGSRPATMKHDRGNRSASLLDHGPVAFLALAERRLRMPGVGDIGVRRNYPGE